MESRSTSLEASTTQPLAATQWDDLVDGAGRLCCRLFPQGQVALRVVGNAEIKALNRRHRSVDSATDVLSFPALSLSAPLSFEQAALLQGHVGDVALCWDAVRAQAAENGNTQTAEALALLAHSLLHLAGFDHRDENEQARMDELTRQLCSEAGIEVVNFGH